MIIYTFFCIAFLNLLQIHAMITDFRVEPTSRNTARVLWNVVHTKDPPPKVKYKISYSRSDGSEWKNIEGLTGDKTKWFKFIGRLDFHSTYQFKITSDVYAATEWLNLTMDIRAFNFNADLKLFHKDAFKNSLKKLLPSGFLLAREITFKRTEEMESWVDVQYEIFFSMGSGVTSKSIEDSFADDKIQDDMKDYLRGVKAKTIKYCGSELSDCHMSAICYDKDATFTCKCKLGYIDGSPDPNFPGKSCVPTPGAPTYTKVWYVGRNKVVIQTRAPPTKKEQGTVTNFEVEWVNKSGVVETTGRRLFELKPFPRLVMDGMTGGHWYDVRIRAVTTICSGKWSKWYTMHMKSDLYKVEFDVELFDHPEDYDFIKEHVHETISKEIFNVVQYDKELNISDFESYRSEMVGFGKIRVWNKLFFTKKPLKAAKPSAAQLYEYKKLLMEPLAEKLTIPAIGKIIEGSINVQDYSECRDSLTGCYSENGCHEVLGNYKCICPRLMTDISHDFKMDDGRVCINIASPPDFRAILLDRQTIRLSWGVPETLRRDRINFWFVLRMKKNRERAYSAKKVQLPRGNFTEPGFVVFNDLQDLDMGIKYHFQVTAQVGKQYGRLSKWISIETSDYIFMATLTLTSRTQFSYDLIDKETQQYSQLLARIYAAVDKTLKQPLPQFISAGEAQVMRKDPESSEVVVTLSLFFDPDSKMEESKIEQMFHNSPLKDTDDLIDWSKTVVLDYDECNSEWNDCPMNSTCINQSPGFSCECYSNFKDWSHLKDLPAGRYCVPEDYTTTVSTTTEAPTTVMETTAAKKSKASTEKVTKTTTTTEKTISDEDSIYGGRDASWEDFKDVAGGEDDNQENGGGETTDVGNGFREEKTFYEGEGPGGNDVSDFDDRRESPGDETNESNYESVGSDGDNLVPTDPPDYTQQIPDPKRRPRPDSSAPGPDPDKPGQVWTRVRAAATPATTTVKAVLPMPKLLIYGRGVDRRTLLITWIRRSTPPNLQDLRYVFRHKIKGTSEWLETEISAQIRSFTLRNLMENIVYQICVAEKWAAESEPHTSFSIPIEARVVVHSYLVHLHLTDVPAPSGGMAGLQPGSQQYEYLNHVTAKYTQDVLSANELRAQFPAVIFGSTDNEATFNRHPDGSLTAFVKIYMTPRRSLTAKLIQQAFETTQMRIKSETDHHIKFWKVSDINECGNEELNDCPHSAICTNTPGSYLCRCEPGYYDDSHFYYLLTGRFCNVPTTTTTQSTTTTTKRFEVLNENGEVAFTHRNGTFTSKITFDNGYCPPGQARVDSKCVDVLLYHGELDVLPANDMRTDAKPTRELMRKSLAPKIDEIFSSFGLGASFQTSAIQKFSNLKRAGGVRAMFLVSFLGPPRSPSRSKRQVNIFGNFPPPSPPKVDKAPDVRTTTTSPVARRTTPRVLPTNKITRPQQSKKAVNLREVRSSLQFFVEMNSRAMTGSMNSRSGSSISYVIKNINLFDVDECANDDLNDCDAASGRCINKDGSFDCVCSSETIDQSSNFDMRPGRRCASSSKPGRSRGDYDKPNSITDDDKWDTDRSGKGQRGENDASKRKPLIDERALKMGLWTSIGVVFIVLCIVLCHCRQLRNKIKRDKYNHISSRETSKNSSIQEEVVEVDRKVPSDKKQKKNPLPPPPVAKNEIVEIGSDEDKEMDRPRRKKKKKRRPKQEDDPPPYPRRSESLHQKLSEQNTARSSARPVKSPPYLGL